MGHDAVSTEVAGLMVGVGVGSYDSENDNINDDRNVNLLAITSRYYE